MDRKLLIGILIGIAISFSFSVFFNSADPLPQVNAREGAKGTTDNGDVNGSGKIDLADAIYLLTYLYADGPEPEAIECGEAACALPATGQTKCYNTENIEIGCNSEEYPGQDGFYQAGCSMENRFTDNKSNLPDLHLKVCRMNHSHIPFYDRHPNCG